jgi:anhydro-N-acetylmuramic acid kinase
VKPERYIGLMSGSSLDGIDAVLVSFESSFPQLHAHFVYPLEPGLVRELDALTRPGTDELTRLCRADVLLGECFAKAVMNLLDQAGITSTEVHAIGSHGQTVRHYPDSLAPTTLQVGDPNIIAERTGITTVADFRRRDMAAGGQGAPLVPAFHQAVLHDPDRNRVIVNIGGIANVTLLPANLEAGITGFDTGPGNALLDAWIKQQRNENYDHHGEWAASGHVHPELLTALLGEPYFFRAAPKSTGRDMFNLEWLTNCWPTVMELSPVDVQATLLELTAVTIADAIRQATPEPEQVLICGGGVHNITLLQRLNSLLPEQQVLSTKDVGLDPDWVEAMAFAWLARQTLKHQAGNLPVVTGARHPVVLGGIYAGDQKS